LCAVAEAMKNPFEKAEEKFWIDGDSTSEEELDDKKKNSNSEEDETKAMKEEEQWKKKWKNKFANLASQELTAKNREISTTQAILSCPGCFCLICDECQRHEKQFNRWRALEAIDCTIGDETIYDSETTYYRKVFCTNCGTQVGAIDEEEVYHFFGILPSSPLLGKK
jgi:hypothetical protein